MAGDFWTSANLDPKRAYRFQAMFSNTNIPGQGSYYIKSVQKPGIEISAKEHMYLGHKFFYPGIVSWNPNPIEIKMVDPVTENAAAILAKIIEDSGYRIPNNGDQLSTISKARSTNQLGGFSIYTLNADGLVVDMWELKNPFIKSVKFGDHDYSKEDLIEVTLQIQYDWCEFTSPYGPGGTVFKPQGT